MNLRQASARRRLYAMPSSYCFVLDFNFRRPCVIVRELVVLLLQACLSVVIIFLACNPSQSYIKLCSYFCPFYFLLRLLCLVVCSFICLACLCACSINSAGTSLFAGLIQNTFVGFSFLFIVLTRLTPYRSIFIYFILSIFLIPVFVFPRVAFSKGNLCSLSDYRG